MRWAFWRNQSPGGHDQRGAGRANERANERDNERGSLGSDPAAGALRVRARARRRLIGAAALLLAVVIVVPLLFDPAPRPIADNIPIEIPSDKTPFAPRLSLPQTPESGAPTGAGSPTARGAPPSELAEPDSATAPSSYSPSGPSTPPASGNPATGAAPSVPVVPAATSVPAAPPAPAAAVAPAAPAPAAGAESRARGAATAAARPKAASSAADAALARGLLEGRSANPGPTAVVARAATIEVQVAALASETAAQELSDRLRGNGFTPFTERTETRDGLRFRVRVGPFGNRDEAERARARLRALGVDANLVAP